MTNARKKLAAIKHFVIQQALRNPILVPHSWQQNSVELLTSRLPSVMGEICEIQHIGYG
jgi:hypothetical protein